MTADQAGPPRASAALPPARHGVRSVVHERHRDAYPLPRAARSDGSTPAHAADSGSGLNLG